jgi:hypothetical protein
MMTGRKTMTTAPPRLTEDDAVQYFFTMLRAQWGPPSGEVVPEAPEQAEARRFRCAEEVLRLLCSDPRACTDRRCRRLTLCRHFAELHARQRDGRWTHPRRTPGAAALRRAIWLYMNAARG